MNFSKEARQLECIKTVIMQSLKETALTNRKYEKANFLTSNDSRILLLFGMQGLSGHWA